MRIAGVTWWRGNYGSILQAYALAHTLNSIEGIEYEVLDQFGSMKSIRGVLERARDKRPSQIAKKLRWNYLMPQLKQRRAALDSFIDTHLPVSDKSYGMPTISEANDSYDGFVCGSDQIWNPNLGPLSDLYWLAFVHESKLKVAYAPSMGIDALTPEQAEHISQMAQRFDALSCREEDGAHLIAEASDMPCTHVADPTLLLTQDEWERLAHSKHEQPPVDRPYAFAYLLRSTEEARKAIETYCARRGLSIACFPYLDPEHAVGYDRHFGDYRIFDAGPAEFISLIADASCVFCDSFHASIFSILMHRTFYLFPKVGERYSSRLDDLLSTLGIGPRGVDAPDLPESIAKLPAIDWPEVDKRVEAFRASSLGYLHKSLGAS